MAAREASMNSVVARAAALRSALQSELEQSGLREQLRPPDAWHLDNQSATGSVFGGLGPLLNACSLALTDQPAAVRSLFGGHVASALIESFDLAQARLVLAPDLHQLYVREFGRMLDHAQVRTAYWADLHNDGPRKDLALLAGRLVPIGSGVAAPRSGLGRSTLWRGNAGQAFRFAQLLWQTGGATRWLEIHTHTDNLSEFNPEGWMRTYRRLARRLRANPAIRGVFRASWFLDPALQAISPNLAYMAALPRSGGAGIFYVEHDHSGTCGALQRSDRRRQAFEAGQYVPAIYLMAWPRNELLAWFDRTSDESAAQAPSAL